MKSSAFSLNVQSIYNWYRQIIRNPKYRWWVILGTLVYILSPLDFVPDFIPIAGELDDIVLFTLLVSEVSQLLIDRVKTTKGQETADAASPVSNTQPVDSVDVNAVKVD